MEMIWHWAKKSFGLCRSFSTVKAGLRSDVISGETCIGGNAALVTERNVGGLKFDETTSFAILSAASRLAQS